MAEDTGDLTAQAEETLAAEETLSRPEWLPEQYADEQAFANAHREAQRKITEQGNDLSRLREELESLSELVQEQPAQQQYGDAAQNPFVLAYERAVQDGDVAAQLAIQAQLTDTVIQQRLEAQAKQQSGDRRGLDPFLIRQTGEQVAARHGADEAMQAKAFEIMETNPVIAKRMDELNRDPNATLGDVDAVVDTAYQLARGGIVQAQQQTSLAQQQAQQDLDRKRKLDAETLSGTGTREANPDEQAALFARIKGMNTGGLRLGEQ